MSAGNLFGVLASSWIVSVLGTTECNEKYECFGSTLTDYTIDCNGFGSCYFSTINATNLAYCGGYLGCAISTVTSGDQIYCWALGSCMSNTLTVTNTNGGEILCYGPISCNNAIMIGTDETTIECDSWWSCVDSIIENVNDTHCSSSYSCSKANITSINSLYGDGPHSLNSAIITYTPEINANGYKSFDSSIISSYGLSKIVIDSQGEYALENANLYCYSGSECIVKCAPGSSCNGLNYYCENGANCILGCNNDCTDCPNIINVDSFDLLDIESIVKQNRYINNQQLDMIMSNIQNEDINELDKLVNKKGFNKFMLLSANTENTVRTIYGEYGGAYVFYGLVWIAIAIFCVGLYQLYKWTNHCCQNNCKNDNANSTDSENREYRYQSI